MMLYFSVIIAKEKRFLCEYFWLNLTEFDRIIKMWPAKSVIIRSKMSN